MTADTPTIIGEHKSLLDRLLSLGVDVRTGEGGTVLLLALAAYLAKRNRRLTAEAERAAA